MSMLTFLILEEKKGNKKRIKGNRISGVPSNIF